MRKFLVVSVLAILLMYSVAGRADAGWAGYENYVVTDKARESQHYYVFYKYLRSYVVDEYLQVGLDFQERIKTANFTTEAAARAYLAEQGTSLMTTGEWGGVGASPITELDGEVLWSATGAWDGEWEARYAQWVATEVDAQFHQRYRIATDCADVAISLRWIFARMHKLPMASTLAGSQRLITNETVLRSWVGLPTSEVWHQDRRFLTALDYILNNTFTHSLLADSYPVAITRQALTAGAHHLDLYSVNTGHTRLVNFIDYELGGIYLIASTVPRDVREMWLELYADAYGQEKLQEGGFLKFRWPEKVSGQWQMRERKQMPDYSTEQYHPDFAEGYRKFSLAVEAKVGAVLQAERRAQALISMLREKIEARISIVEEGYAFCRVNDCSEGSEGFEAWSTPHRDGVIKMIYYELSEVAGGSYDAGEIYRRFVNEMISVAGKELRYGSFYNHLIEARASSDPRDPIARRWGLE